MKGQITGVLQVMMLALILSIISGSIPLVAVADDAARSSSAPTPLIVVSPGSDDRFYKLTIGPSGVYAVTYEVLLAAGLPVATLDPATFQIFEQGQETARRVVDANDNSSFDAGDAILFYGRAVDTDFTGANVYWLTYGYAPGLTMTERPGAPDPGLPVAETFRETLHLEQNTRWSKGLPKTGVADRWYWTIYATACTSSTNPKPAKWSTTVSTPGVAAGDHTAVLTPRLRGFNDVPAHNAIFDLNGTQIGQAQFTYQNEFLGSFSFSQALLNDGATPVSNTITLTAPCITTGSGGTIDYGAVNWFDLTYSRTYAAPATGQFPFAVDASQPSSVTLTGLPDPTAEVYDITDPLQPVLLTGAQVTGADLAFAHALAAPARYVAAAASQHLTPASIAPDAPSQLRNRATGADWIIISHRDFIGEAERLAAHRQQYQHYRTAVVDAQDVYDEFNGGLMDQEAIRDFLRHAYETWPRPAPQFVVLLGDGHYDPRARSWNYPVSGAPFFIPPYLAPVDPFEGMAAADNRFVAYDPPPGQSNPLPFMHLGRLPANSAAEAATMVDKTIAYETTPAHADWNATTIFVADNSDAGGLFPESSNLVATDPYYLPGYALTTDVPGATNPISLTLAATATVTVNFGFRQPPDAAFSTAASGLDGQPAAMNTIQGRIWEDLNGNRIMDAGEGPLPDIGVCVYRDPNFNGKIDATDPLIGCTASDSNGNYRFDALADDHYLLAVNELDPDLPSTFRRRSLYCDRVVATDVTTFFCTQDGGTARLNATASKSALLNLINSGALFVNYHGHASPDKWADETLLKASDLSGSLTNKDRYPIMLPMTCLEGQYIDLTVSGLGETIVRLKDAGAVASWSPTGKGTSNGHEIIWTAFYEAIFENGERLIGPATTYAKGLLYESDRVFKDLIDTYILFGDPALPLDLPAADLWVEKQALPRTAWLPGQAITYTLTYGNAGVVTAANVYLTDTLSSDIIHRAWLSSDPGVTGLAGPDYAWRLSDLAPGASGTITVTGVYSPSAPGASDLKNGATIASDAWERPAHLPDNAVQANRIVLAGYIYRELGGNTAFDPGVDQGIANVQLVVTDGSGSLVASPMSDDQGHWWINLPPGSYMVTAPPQAEGSTLLSPSPVAVNATEDGVTGLSFGYVAPTGLEIEGVHAVWLTDGAKVLWRTRDETLVKEFNVYRSTTLNAYGDRLNPSPIPPKTGSDIGAEYDYVDDTVRPGAGIFYWLQVISLVDDSASWYGPLIPTAQAKVYLPLVLTGK